MTANWSPMRADGVWTKEWMYRAPEAGGNHQNFRLSSTSFDSSSAPRLPIKVWTKARIGSARPYSDKADSIVKQARNPPSTLGLGIAVVFF